jgi:ribonuclease P protein component
LPAASRSVELLCWRRFKLQRLKTRAQFQFALAGGTVARTEHFALHCAALELPLIKPEASESPGIRPKVLFDLNDVWLGAMVPKRWAKRAVTRNAIKRQIYAVSADFDASLAKVAHVVRLRATFDRAQFISASSDVLKFAVRLELERLFTKALARGLAPAHAGAGA